MEVHRRPVFEIPKGRGMVTQIREGSAEGFEFVEIRDVVKYVDDDGNETTRDSHGYLLGGDPDLLMAVGKALRDLAKRRGAVE